jgi:hypothetical protein
MITRAAKLGPGLGAPRHTEETRPRTDGSKGRGVSLHLTPHEALSPVTRTSENPVKGKFREFTFATFVDRLPGVTGVLRGLRGSTPTGRLR